MKYVCMNLGIMISKKLICNKNQITCIHKDKDNNSNRYNKYQSNDSYDSF